MRDILQANKYATDKPLPSYSQKQKQQQSEGAKLLAQSATNAIIDVDNNNNNNINSNESALDYSKLTINPVEFANSYNRKLYETFGYQPLLDDEKNNTDSNSKKNSSIVPLQPTHLLK